MSKPALPRPIGATVLALAALILARRGAAQRRASPPRRAAARRWLRRARPSRRRRWEESSEKLTVELSNVTEESLLVQNFGIEGADAGDFTVNEYSCGVVSSGASCTFGIYFSPQSVGEEHATLRVGLLEPAQRVRRTLRHRRRRGTHLLAAEPRLRHPVGSTKTASFTFQLTNSGEAAAQLGQHRNPQPRRQRSLLDRKQQLPVAELGWNRASPAPWKSQFGPREAIRATRVNCRPRSNGTRLLGRAQRRRRPRRTSKPPKTRSTSARRPSAAPARSRRSP